MIPYCQCSGSELANEKKQPESLQYGRPSAHIRAASPATDNTSLGSPRESVLRHSSKLGRFTMSQPGQAGGGGASAIWIGGSIPFQNLLPINAVREAQESGDVIGGE